MASISFPNTGHNNRAVTQAEFEQIAVPLGLSGLLDYTGTMPVLADSSGMQVKLRAGVHASIRGIKFVNSTETVVSIGANASGNPRIDLVVLRLTRSTYQIAPAVRQGVAAASPVAPSAVRDNTLDGSGVWEIPLCEVLVANGAATIAAGNLTHRAWWINGSGYISQTDGRPAAEPGVPWFEANTNTQWVGMNSGEYRRLAYSTGVVTVGPGSGWTGGLDFVRTPDMVFMNVNVRRTGATLANTVSPVLATVIALYRPPKLWNGVYHCSFPDHSSNIWIDADGTVTFAGTQNSDGIESGAYIFGSASWPAANA